MTLGDDSATIESADSLTVAGTSIGDAQQLKDTLASFPTGVTVVTAVHDGQIHGMTANAFCSVSLDPPMVLVCVEKSARMHDFVALSGAFAVNILSSEQEHLARHFSRRSRPILGEFSYAPHVPGATGSPILARVAGYLECRLRGAHDAGDHTIYVGEVLESQAFLDRQPLLYVRRQYAPTIAGAEAARASSS
jgi:flavin reductase (DIM6/NTAB) family NADH-FMN oxidoreductase RutF